MAEWFRRKSEKIKTLDKREIAEGMWIKCPQCQEVVYRKMLEENHFICTSCTHHFRITSDDYIQLLMDDGKYEEIAGNVQSVDPLNFNAAKNYTDQIRTAQEKTGNKDAVKTIAGEINGLKAVLAIMDFTFIGGSMGSVVGEKISQAIDRAAKDIIEIGKLIAIEKINPFISKSIPMESAIDAIKMIGDRKIIGKVVLFID